MSAGAKSMGQVARDESASEASWWGACMESLHGRHCFLSTARSPTSPNKRLTSRTMAVHAHYNSSYIFLSTYANQQREMTNFQVYGYG